MAHRQPTPITGVIVAIDEVRQRASAPRSVDGWSGRLRQNENNLRDKFKRYTSRDRHNADLNRKVLSAITAKIACMVHAIIKSSGEYLPFIEGSVPGGRTLSVKP